MWAASCGAVWAASFRLQAASHLNVSYTIVACSLKLAACSLWLAAFSLPFAVYLLPCVFTALVWKNRKEKDDG